MTDIGNIKKLMEDPNEELRVKGLSCLKGAGDDSSIDLLIASLGDDSWRVRKIAVELLSGFMDRAKILPHLIVCLRSDDNAGLRNAAVETLENIGTGAVDTLLLYIADDDHDLRKQVVDILGNIGDKKVTPHLIRSLSDPDENVKSAAAENLGKIGDDEAVRSLIDALKKEDLLLQFSALEALCRIGRAVPVEEIRPLLDNPLLRKASLEVLGSSGDIAALPMLISGLEARSKSTKEAAVVSVVQLVESIDVRDRAISLIAEGRGVLPELVSSCLAPGNVNVAVATLKLLGWLESVESIPAMLELAIDDEISPVVVDVIRDMGLAAEKQLIESYAGSPDEIKPMLCLLLGEIASVESVNLLIRELGSDIGHVRHSSAASLGKIGDKRAIGPIIAILDDPYVDVQSAAVQAISELVAVDRDRVVAIIKKGILSGNAAFRRNCSRIQASMGKEADLDIALSALRDEDAVVRRHAVDSLGAIGGEDATRQIILLLSDENKEVRIAAAGQLALMKCEEGFQPLLALLKDEDIWVRVAAIKGIAEIDGKKSASHIANLLDDEVGLIVITSLEALGRLRAVSHAPMMMKKIKNNDSEIVKAAVESLSFWGDDDYLSELIAMLSNENWEVRLSAVRVLAGKGRHDLLLEIKESEDNELVKKAAEGALEYADIK